MMLNQLKPNKTIAKLIQEGQTASFNFYRPSQISTCP